MWHLRRLYCQVDFIEPPLTLHLSRDFINSGWNINEGICVALICSQNDSRINDAACKRSDSSLPVESPGVARGFIHSETMVFKERIDLFRLNVLRIMRTIGIELNLKTYCTKFENNTVSSFYLTTLYIHVHHNFISITIFIYFTNKL